jgi:hypothetical protein
MKSEASLTRGGDGSDRRGWGEKMGQLCLSPFPLSVQRMTFMSMVSFREDHVLSAVITGRLR